MFINKWLQANTGGSGGGSGQSGTGSGQGTAAGQGLGQGTGQKQEAAPTFETWLEKQDDTVKGLLDGHVKGLKSALTSEREIREGTEKQLRELAKKSEKGSEAEKRLTEMADQIEAADRRSDFYEEAHKAGITNLKLAYLVATQDKLFDGKGRINFEEMKKSYPELFGGKPVPDGNAGSGTEGGAGGAKDMNSLIRKAAGRST